MTAISLQPPPQHSQYGHGQNAAQHQRAAAMAASTASSPARNPGSFARQTTLAMSQLHAQYAEVSGPRQNGTARSVSPGHAAPSPGQPTMNGRRAATSPVPASTSQRPSSAPGDNQGAPPAPRADGGHSDNAGQRPAVARPNKPTLHRSKSEYGLRQGETDDADEEHYEWGARHGFEDHYQSEDIISQLANVSDIFLSKLQVGQLRASSTSQGTRNPHIVQTRLPQTARALAPRSRRGVSGPERGTGRCFHARGPS